MNEPILVTGATGNVGSAVVAALRAHGIPARPGLRDPGRDPDAVHLDFLQPETFAPALAGAGGLFLLRPPPISDMRSTLNALVDVALASGVRRIVFLSVIGADTRGYIPHAKVEKHLSQSTAEWTFLRAGFFAQNLGDAYRPDIRDKGELFVPAGAGKAAFVDVRDIAEVAALAFADPEHIGQAYTLTGPEALGFTDVAALLSATLGREIRYARPGALRYLLRMRRRGLPWAQALVQTVLHVGLRYGQAEAVDPTLAQLLGRPPRTLAQYIVDHAALWPSTRRKLAKVDRPSSDPRFTPESAAPPALEEFRRRLAETQQWCSARVHTDDPAGSLRTLMPPETAAEEPWSGSLDTAAVLVEAVVARRRAALVGAAQLPAPTGRLLAYDPSSNLCDGAAEVESEGVLDIDNGPPSDTWLCLLRRPGPYTSWSTCLLAWIPAELVSRVQGGIDVNPEACILWATDVDRMQVEYLAQLHAADLLF